ERLPAARTQVLVTHEVERDLGCRRQDQWIEMDVLGLRLPLADDGNLLVDDIVGRQRMARDEQDEDVARLQLARDLPLPVGTPGHHRVDPDFDCAVLDRWLQIAGHERQPPDIALGRLLRLVLVGVADDDERLFRLGRHGNSIAGPASAGVSTSQGGIAAANGTVVRELAGERRLKILVRRWRAGFRLAARRTNAQARSKGSCRAALTAIVNNLSDGSDVAARAAMLPMSFACSSAARTSNAS